MEKHSISCNSYPPKSLMSNIDAAKPTGNFQYSRKLELLNFRVHTIYFKINHTSTGTISALPCRGTSAHDIRGASGAWLPCPDPAVPQTLPRQIHQRKDWNSENIETDNGCLITVCWNNLETSYYPKFEKWKIHVQLVQHQSFGGASIFLWSDGTISQLW